MKKLLRQIKSAYSLVLFFLIFLEVPLASAHENDVWPYVVVSCSKEKRVLTISENIAKSEAEILKIKNAWSLDGMLQFVPMGDQDGVLKIRAPLKHSCTLGKGTYQFSVRPHLYNFRVQGMCGAAAPSTQLTIIRNGKLLFRDLVFRINCAAEGNTDAVIKEVSFFENEKNAKFGIDYMNNFIRKDIGFKELPTLQRNDLFQ